MKSRTKFTLLMILYAFLGVAVICGVMLLLWKYADAYEISQPDKAIIEYVDDLNKNFWNGDVEEAAARLSTPYQSAEERNYEISSFLMNGAGYTPTYGNNFENEKNFAIIVLDKRIGTVTLEKDKSTELAFGILPWRVKDAEMDFSFLMDSEEFTVPENYSATMNGIAVGEDAIVEKDIPFDCLKDYYSCCENLATKRTYKCDYISYCTQPALKIFNAYGQEYTVDENRDDSQYLEVCATEAVEMLTNFVNRFTRLYLTFRAGYTREDEEIYDVFSRLAPYFVDGSELQERLHSACEGLSWSHCTGISLKNITMTSAMDIGNNQYLVDIYAKVSTTGPHGLVENETNIRCVVADYSGDRRVLSVEES